MRSLAGWSQKISKSIAFDWPCGMFSMWNNPSSKTIKRADHVLFNAINLKQEYSKKIFFQQSQTSIFPTRKGWWVTSPLGVLLENGCSAFVCSQIYATPRQGGEKEREETMHDARGKISLILGSKQVDTFHPWNPIYERFKAHDVVLIARKNLSECNSLVTM